MNRASPSPWRSHAQRVRRWLEGLQSPALLLLWGPGRLALDAWLGPRLLHPPHAR